MPDTTQADTKSFVDYEYRSPLSVREPTWSTDREAMRWNKGGYSKDTIPSGVYEYISPYGSAPYLGRIGISVDKLLELPDDATTEVLDHVVDFWSKESAFRELNIVYKRGIILYGPPGAGKSATIYRLVKKLEEHNAVMVMAQSAGEARAAIAMIKSLEQSRKIVIIFEDIDGIIRSYGDESMTHLLDGGTDVDNTLFLATTNYPERIPARVLNRPSRFDVVIKIGMPTEAARRVYVTALVNNLLIDIDQLVTETDGMSIAEIKEVVILVHIFSYEITTAVKRVRSFTIGNKSFKDTSVPVEK